ncbi:MAG: hypothetical protein ACMXYD_00645 [Candidatus Woesearchaeota archaeon]
MELGGNIELFGADTYDDNQLIIIKKLVGHYTKHFTEEHPSFEGLTVRFDVHNAEYALEAQLLLGEEEIVAQAQHKNIYFALDAVLKALASKIEA